MSDSENEILREPSPEMVPDIDQQQPSSLDPAEYMEDRVKQYQSWYDAKAGRYKRLYLRLRILTVVAATLVPVVVNIEFDGKELVVSGLGLVAAVLVSLEGVLHHREQWKNYRTAEQSLGFERIQYMARIGPYAGLSAERAFIRFVDRVETAIQAENAATLSILTAPPATQDERI